MSIRVLLVSEEGPARRGYLLAIGGPDVQVDVVDSPRSVKERIQTSTYQGVVVDMHTLMRDRTYDKRELFRLEERLPVIRVRLDPATGDIAGVSCGEAIRGKASLKEFIVSQCGCAKSSASPLAHGVPLNLAVMICPSRSSPEEACGKSVTLRVALAGCSVFAPAPPEEGALVWLVFPDLNDRTPIPSRVVWRVPWGGKRAAPGMGLAFASLTQAQLRELTDMGLSGPQPPLAPDLQDV
ncbi:PilZ domain-containing protein [Fundidesulfovibrio soli]|uniref:PilZ domain-containing protein n=1 Tax=Fundidesulfovibrio soli TaxID=2922716 RepID=UPI001FAFED34|nr:PilZ domain-containing protein [Fundidesulfovibrio soli]